MIVLSRWKKQLVKFALIGSLALLVDLGCYYVLINILPEKAFSLVGNEVVAKSISFLCGLSVTYFFNRSWTWKQKGGSRGQLYNFIVLYGLSLILNVTANSFFLFLLHGQEYLAWVPKKYLVAFIGAAGISAVMTFLGQKFWVFRAASKAIKRASKRDASN
ncbi:MAG: GtrA family protein [Sediminicola sp.]|tara:strand:+ start:69082 stop:69564 length:483 start_codon:yes stop_codon:yes gene_type:complete